MNQYEQQANSFLEATDATIHIKPLGFSKHFSDDRDRRFRYEITISRGNRKMTFIFGGSLNDAESIIKANLSTYTYQGHASKDFHYPSRVLADNNLLQHFDEIITKRGIAKLDSILEYGPTNYSILASLTKYDPGDFADFCAEYGYDEDSRKAERTYNAVKQEWNDLQRLFTDEELSQLAEIN